MVKIRGEIQKRLRADTSLVFSNKIFKKLSYDMQKIVLMVPIDGGSNSLFERANRDFNGLNIISIVNILSIIVSKGVYIVFLIRFENIDVI